MRALITGATGFIGHNFARKMLAAGHEVHLIVRDPGKLAPDLIQARVHEYSGKGEDLSVAVAASQPDVVFHFASLFLADHKFDQIADLCDSNLKFPTQLVDAMLTAGCKRLVSAGTAWQNHDGRKGVATNLYAATKEAFEAILRYYVDAQGLSAWVLKLNDTYGAGDPRRKLLAILRDSYRKNEALGLSPGEQKIDLLHVDDAVDAFRLAGEKITTAPAGFAEYYLRSGRLVSIKELVGVFDSAIGKKLEANWGARPYRAREVMLPAQEGPILPDWKPKISLEKGLKDYFNEGI